MKDIYFKWERESTIHLIYPTLEGSMLPPHDFSWIGYPTTILIFKNGIVTWCCKEDQFYKLGAKLLKVYKDKQKEQEMVEKINKRAEDLKKVEEQIDKINLSELTNDKLIEWYFKLHDSFVNYYGIGAMDEPISMEVEAELKRVTSLTDSEIASLTTPDHPSYSQQADNYLLQTKDIAGFIKKYYWIENNYSGTKVLSKDDVIKRLNHLKPARISPKSEISNLTADAKRLIQLLKIFTSYQDERKTNILIYLHFLEKILTAVGLRSHIGLDVLRDTFPWELEDILKGKISADFIKKRRENCCIVWKEGAKKADILDKKDSLEWEKKFAVESNKSQMIKGNCASKGKVTGKVRILLNASENDLLQDGEILVTFMTSPDFMGAVKRSAGLITNLGGITSHAAIISRELGIPCIVGTKNATEILETGDIVELDASNGTVKKIN